MPTLPENYTQMFHYNYAYRLHINSFGYQFHNLRENSITFLNLANNVDKIVQHLLHKDMQCMYITTIKKFKKSTITKAQQNVTLGFLERFPLKAGILMMLLDFDIELKGYDP